VSLADRFKTARLQVGLTQVQLAEAVGATQSTISDLERGVTEVPGADLLVRAAQVLQADPGFLLFGTLEPAKRLTTSVVRLETEQLEEQEALLRVYLRLSPAHKRALLSIARALRETERPELTGSEQ
jgi:transcriptional regulator with XRE-family HTH domain